jgi:hypothetical protein
VDSVLNPDGPDGMFSPALDLALDEEDEDEEDEEQHNNMRSSKWRMVSSLSTAKRWNVGVRART